MRRARLIACLAVLTFAAPSLAALRTIDNVAYGSGPQQTMDVYLPEPATTPSPVIFVVHGGIWRMADKKGSEVVTNKAPYYQQKGYAVVSANYTMALNVLPSTQVDDLRLALQAVHDHAKEWNVDPQRLVLMGHSAGAQLVAMLAAQPNGTISPRDAILLDAAGLDVSSIMAKPHPGFYNEVFGSDPAVWKANSPIDALAPSMGPLLLVCATHSMWCQNSEEFIARAKVKGVRIEYFEANKDHMHMSDDIGKDMDYTTKIDQFIAAVF